MYTVRGSESHLRRAFLGSSCVFFGISTATHGSIIHYRHPHAKKKQRRARIAPSRGHFDPKAMIRGFGCLSTYSSSRDQRAAFVSHGNIMTSWWRRLYTSFPIVSKRVPSFITKLANYVLTGPGNMRHQTTWCRAEFIMKCSVRLFESLSCHTLSMNFKCELPNNNPSVFPAS